MMFIKHLPQCQVKSNCVINVTCYYRVLGYYLLSVCFSSVFSGRAARWNREAPPILEVFLLLRKMRPSRGRCLVQGESRSTGTELGLQTTFLTPSLARGQAPPPIAFRATLSRTLDPCGDSEPCARPRTLPIHGWAHPPFPRR